MPRRSDRIEIKGFDPTARIKPENERAIVRAAQEATEELAGRARQQERDSEASRERIAEGRAYQERVPREQRLMDARDRVAQRIAQTEGVSHTEAQSRVAEHMRRNRR